MGNRRDELRNAAGLIFKSRKIVALQDLKISFYMHILVPLLLASAPSLSFALATALVSGYD